MFARAEGLILLPSQNGENGGSGTGSDLLKVTSLFCGRGRISTLIFSNLAFALISPASFPTLFSPRLCPAPAVSHACLPRCRSSSPHCCLCYFFSLEVLCPVSVSSELCLEGVRMSSRPPSLIPPSEEVAALYLHSICALYIYCCNRLVCLPTCLKAVTKSYLALLPYSVTQINICWMNEWIWICRHSYNFMLKWQPSYLQHQAQKQRHLTTSFLSWSAHLKITMLFILFQCLWLPPTPTKQMGRAQPAAPLLGEQYALSSLGCHQQCDEAASSSVISFIIEILIINTSPNFLMKCPCLKLHQP